MEFKTLVPSCIMKKTELFGFTCQFKHVHIVDILEDRVSITSKSLDPIFHNSNLRRMQHVQYDLGDFSHSTSCDSPPFTFSMIDCAILSSTTADTCRYSPMLAAWTQRAYGQSNSNDL